MRKLISVLGSIIMGMNVGAMSTNAMDISKRSQANNEEEIFSEIMRKYDFVFDCSEDEGWTLHQKIEAKNHRQIRSTFRGLLRGLEGKSGLLDFTQSTARYSEFRETLVRAIENGLLSTCYVLPDATKTEGWGLFAKNFYQIFKNEGNVKLVETNLPVFLSTLKTYLYSKDAKQKNALKTKMKNSLTPLPEVLSELIVAALKIHKIEL